MFVIRVKREFTCQINDNLEKFLEIVEQQVVNLLQIGGTSKIMGYTFDFHQTIYRKDVEMRKVMSDYPKRIKWIPTQDLSRTIPYLMQEIWDG